MVTEILEATVLRDEIFKPEWVIERREIVRGTITASAYLMRWYTKEIWTYRVLMVREPFGETIVEGCQNPFFFVDVQELNPTLIAEAELTVSRKFNDYWKVK